jgi:hypothetical protein
MIVAWIALAAALSPAETAAPRNDDIDREKLAQLLVVRRVYVDRLNGGETAAQMRDMIISSLERSRLFVVTENQDRADATLRGSAEDLIFTDTFSASEGVNARANVSANDSGYVYGSRGSVRRGAAAGVGVGENESLHTQERKHEASASVRLVSKDGDVIWSTTQESLGGKFRGASADVADRITRQLIGDYERARKIRGEPLARPIPASEPANSAVPPGEPLVSSVPPSQPANGFVRPAVRANNPGPPSAH